MTKEKYLFEIRGAPFEGILGNTSEMRILENLMALPKFDFTIAELSENARISRRTADGVIRKFLKWGIVKKGNDATYQLNDKSQLVLSVIAFNRAIIDKMFEGCSSDSSL